ncbi:MAG: lipoprotein signal peptidase [Ottowia sp.]|nr:lipoprotein signal peptidase [Ottowia sp.]
MKKKWLALPWFALSALIIALDQGSKAAIVAAFYFGEVHPINDYINLVLVGNPGAAFSFLAGAGGWQRWFFTFIGIIATLFISHMLLRNPYNKRLCVGLSMLLGGAIGNVIDRLRYGYVIDFIDAYIGTWHWPAFNIADSAITIGVITLILDEVLRIKKQK